MDLQKTPPKKKLVRDKRKGLRRSHKELGSSKLRGKEYLGPEGKQKNYESILDQLQQEKTALTPEDLAQLFDTLPTHAHTKDVFLNSSTQDERQKLEEEFKKLKKLDWNAKIEALRLLKDNSSLKQTFPLLKFFTFQKEIQLLKEIQAQVLQLQQKFPANLLQPFDSDFLALTHSLLHNLSQYFLSCQPLETLIMQLPLPVGAPRFSILAYLKNLFKKKSVSSETILMMQNAFRSTEEERENLAHLQMVLYEILSLSFGRNALHQTFLGIIAGFYAEDSLPTLGHGMFNQVPNGELFYLLQEHYIISPLSTRKLLLEFFKLLIQLDINYYLVEQDGNVAFLTQVYQFLKDNYLDQAELTLLEPIKMMIEAHAQQQMQNRLHFQNNLASGKLKPDTVLQMLESSAIAYAAQVKTLRSLLLLVYDILEFAPKTFFSQGPNPKLLSALRDIIPLIPLPSHLLMHTHFNVLLERRIQETRFTSPEWVADLPAPNHAFTEQEIAFNQQFELVAQGKLSRIQYKKLVRRSLNAIQRQYATLFSTLQMSELKAFILVMLHTKDKIDPLLFSSVETMINFEKSIRCFIPEVILYQANSDGKKPRGDMKGIGNLLVFFKDVYLLASQKGFWHTALLLQRSFHHPALNSFRVFGIQDIPTYDAEFMPLDQLDFDRCPLMNQLILTLNSLQANCKGAQLFFALGIFFTKILQAQHKATFYKTSNFFNTFLEKRLYDKSTTLFEPESEKYTTSWDKLDEKYVNLANLFIIGSDTLSTLSYQGLLKQLKEANALGLPTFIIRADYVLTGKEASAFLLSTLRQKIQQTHALPSIQLLGNLLSAMQENKNMQNTFTVAKEFAQLLKAMQDSIETHLAKKSIAIEVLSSLKEELHSLQEQSLFQNYFKGSMGETLQKTYHDFKTMSDSWPVDTETTYDEAYLKTLNTYLEGKQQFQLELPASAKQVVDNSDPLTVEFEDYEDESNPEIVGYADTWNVFKQVAESQISGPPFSFHNIKETLIRAFPWTIEDAKQLNVRPIMNNLLYITPSLALQLQKTVMDLVFCAVDNIGKLAGVHGELVLHNLAKIEKIVQTLEMIAQLLNNPRSLQSDQEAEQLKILLDAKIESIRLQNTILHDKLTHRIPLHKAERLASNAPLNQLLHLNEQECHRHIKAQLSDTSLTFESVLTPPLSDAESSSASASPNTDAVDEWAMLADEISKQFDQSE